MGLPQEPRVSRPIARDRVEQALDEFGRDVGPYLTYGATGYVVCRWAEAPLRLWDRIRAFAHLLARREGAVVLDERSEVARLTVPLPPAQRPVRKRRAGANPPEGP
jgi:hypothetical protein